MTEVRVSVSGKEQTSCDLFFYSRTQDKVVWSLCYSLEVLGTIV